MRGLGATTCGTPWYPRSGCISAEQMPTAAASLGMRRPRDHCRSGCRGQTGHRVVLCAAEDCGRQQGDHLPEETLFRPGGHCRQDGQRSDRHVTEYADRPCPKTEASGPDGWPVSCQCLPWARPCHRESISLQLGASRQDPRSPSRTSALTARRYEQMANRTPISS